MTHSHTAQTTTQTTPETPSETTSPRPRPDLAPPPGATSEIDLAPGPLSFGGGEVKGASSAPHSNHHLAPHNRGELNTHQTHHHDTHPTTTTGGHR